MEWILISALLLFLLGALATWLWLVRMAFYDGRLWGWVVLTVPLGGIVYGLLAWREAHRPLLINLALVLLAYMSYSMLVSIQPRYEIHQLARQADATVQYWITEWNRPPAWKNDPEVMGEPIPAPDQADESATATATTAAPGATAPETAATPVENTPATNEVAEGTPARQVPAPATQPAESGEPTEESPPGKSKAVLKTRVVRIGAVTEKDHLAPYRALSPKERIARLNELMWQPMVLCLRRGTRKGTLEEINRTTLTLRQQLASGNFDSIVEIRKIRDVLLPKPRQPLSELRCSS